MDLARSMPPWIARVRALLEDEFARPLRLGEIAHAVGLHPVHVSGKFREVTGAGIATTLQRVRVARALGFADGNDGKPDAYRAPACAMSQRPRLSRLLGMLGQGR